MFCEVPVGGGAASPIYAWFVEGIRSVLPQIAQMGVATGDLMSIDSLEFEAQGRHGCQNTAKPRDPPRSAPGPHSDRNIVSGKRALLDISTRASQAKKWGAAVQVFPASTT